MKQKKKKDKFVKDKDKIKKELRIFGRKKEF